MSRTRGIKAWVATARKSLEGLGPFTYDQIIDLIPHL
jgi:hypothetical protein